MGFLVPFGLSRMYPYMVLHSEHMQILMISLFSIAQVLVSSPRLLEPKPGYNKQGQES